MLRILRFASLLLLAAMSAVSLAQSSSGFQIVNTKPMIDRKATANPPSAPSNLRAKDNGIQYHGGPVMSTPQGVNVYFIWYGDWSSANDTAAQSIVNDFIKNLGGSSYFNINTTYYDYLKGQIDPVRNRVNFMGSTSVGYSYGSALTDNDVGNVIVDATSSGALPFDLNGEYFVLTSSDVDETSGFCTSYCAFHGFQQINYTSPVALSQHSPSAVNLIGAFVGNPDRCPYQCAWQYQLPTPNNNVAGDGMVNMVAHELSESVSDPLVTGWINHQGNSGGIDENGDLCAWTFGQTTNLPNGSFYNIVLGDRPYLLQRIWVNALGGYCSMSWVNGAN